MAGDGFRAGHDVFHGALSYQFSAVYTGAGADVHDVIRCVHSILVVFNHDQGVTDVRQVTEGLKELLVILLMQADGGLVKYVEHANQAGADLSGQPDPLGFSARKASRSAAQGKVVQAHVLKEGQTVSDLLDDHLGDHGVLLA